MPITITGIFELKQRLKNMSASIKFEAARALYEEAQIEMIEAKRRTPVLTGDLQRSGKVNLAQVKDREISVELEFGAGIDYAIVVHENLEAIHPTGQAKFLESVILESAPHMAARVARRIDLAKL